MKEIFLKTCNEKKISTQKKTSTQKNCFPRQLGIRENVMLKPYTSFKVGGPADYFAQPASVNELQTMVKIAGDKGLPCTIMGSGTNILIKDRGIRGLVISLVKMEKELEFIPQNDHETMVTTSAGTILALMCKKTMAHGLEDLSFAAGIPGTVGGAVIMNAGTGTGTISDHLHSIEIMDNDGTIRRVEKSELLFSHRKLEFISLYPESFSPVILKASFLLKKGSRDKILASWDTLMKSRKNSQPHGLPCAGCFFKNPPTGKSAGELIDRAGLKKKRVGDAMVSALHANFIVNMGNATAHDILTLHNIIKESVKEQFGINLSAEVIVKGE